MLESRFNTTGAALGTATVTGFDNAGGAHVSRGPPDTAGCGGAGAGATTIVYPWEARLAFELSSAETVKVNVPAVVAVPERRPAEESVRPPGSAPCETTKWYGAEPPAAVIVWR